MTSAFDTKPAVPVKDQPRRHVRRNLAVPLGLLFVVAGVAASSLVLQRTILPEGILEPGSRKLLAWGVCRLFMICIGVVLLWKRPQVTIVHLSAFGFMGAVAAVFGALALQVVYKPPPVLCGWRSLAPVSEQNEFHFRGRPIKYSNDDFVIVLLGDSNVEGMALPMEGMPEQRLEAHLNAAGKRVKVFSVGAGGYGQDQELLALQQYLKKYRADLVVLWQTPWNDVWNNVFKTHMLNRNPKPTFWLQDGRLCGPSESMEQPMANSKFVLGAMFERIFGLPRRDHDWEKQLPEPYKPFEHCDGPANNEWQERWNTNLGRMRDENLATEKSHLSIMLNPRSKRMQYGLDLTRALTKQIEETVKTNGAKLAIFQVDQHEFVSDQDEMHPLNGKCYLVSKRQFEENWRYVNEGFDASIMPVTIADWRVAPEDGHLNRQATDQVMGDLAQRLRHQIPDKTL